MDIHNLIITSLKAGAMAVSNDDASSVMKDSYNKLKQYIKEKHNIELVNFESNPNSDNNYYYLLNEIRNKIDNEDDEAAFLAKKIIKNLEERSVVNNKYYGRFIDKNTEGSKVKKDLTARGALKIEISTSTPVVSAGKEFSIYVVIRNPFPVPVTVFSTETHIPVELSDEIWRLQRDIHERKVFDSKIDKSVSFIEKLSHRLVYAGRKIHRSIRRDAGPRVAVAVSTESYDEIKRISEPAVSIGQATVTGGNITITDVIPKKYELHVEGKSDDEIRGILTDMNDYERGVIPILLNPGDSVVQHFILRTTDWLFFTPIGHTFQIQIRYKIDGSPHVDTVPYQLNIRAALFSSLVGAMLGSFLGSTVNSNNFGISTNDFLYKSIVSLIFAFVVIIAFARKSNVQTIVSVEDFWGGLFIGFLVGYTGEDFIGIVIGSRSG
jgi:hypothetical protein